MAERTSRLVRPVVALASVGLAVSLAACGGGGSGETGSTGGAAAPAVDTPGVTDTTITVGTHQPLTGPAAAGYSTISKATKAYFDYVNSKGGVNGRKIEYTVKDDGYNPANTQKVVRELVLQDKVFGLLNGLGTPTHTGVLDFVKTNKVPDLFVASGSLNWNQPEKYPNTFGFQSNYTTETKISGSYIKENFAGKKVCFFGQDDDFGRDALKGLTIILGEDGVGERQTYVTSNPNVAPQIGKFKPSKLVLVEQAENALFHVHRALVAAYPGLTIVPCIADICDSRRISGIFATERPKVVFHAAAHKHVPMMECNPAEAVKNNVFGTKKVADLSHEHGVEKFVMVSTDKAVNPSSVMGVSKRTAEIYVQALSERSKTAFVTVRFGNVLGSDGSVVPIFKEQIAKGGPVTVTDPEMKRYFMTIPEACQLVLQAGTIGGGGDILLLDMGEPVKIVDLARDLIKLSGLVVGEDIDIVFTGVRPGEKLFEELAIDGEDVDKTKHPKIFVGKFLPHSWSEVETALAALHVAAQDTDAAEIRGCFAALVPEYRPTVPDRPSKVERADKTERGDKVPEAERAAAARITLN